MSAEWPGSDNVRFIVLSVQSESPVGIGCPAIVIGYLRLWQRAENKSLFFFFLSLSVFLLILSLSLPHTFFTPSSLPSFAAQPPLLKMLDRGLATAYRKRTYNNKGRRGGKLSKDQHGVQLKENKKLQISKNVGPPRPYPIKATNHWALNPGWCCKPNGQKELFPLALNENNDTLPVFCVNGTMTVKCVFNSLMWVLSVRHWYLATSDMRDWNDWIR